MDISVNPNNGTCDSCTFTESRVLVLHTANGTIHLCPVCARTTQWGLQDTLRKFLSGKLDDGNS